MTSGNWPHDDTDPRGIGHLDTGPLPTVRMPPPPPRRRRGPDWATVLTAGLAVGLAGGLIAFAGVAGYLHPLTVLKRDIVRDVVHAGSAAPTAPASRGIAVHGSEVPLVNSPAAVPVVVPSPAAPVTQRAQPAPSPVAPRRTRPAPSPSPRRSRSPSPIPSLTITASSPTSTPPSTTVSSPVSSPPHTPPTHPTYPTHSTTGPATPPILPQSPPPSTTASVPSPSPEIS